MALPHRAVAPFPYHRPLQVQGEESKNSDRNLRRDHLLRESFLAVRFAEAFVRLVRAASLSPPHKNYLLAICDDRRRSKLAGVSCLLWPSYWHRGLLNKDDNASNNPELEKTFGGYTAKQRLREEVESPFRTVRLFFFGSSTGSALTALYFSLLNILKAKSGLYTDGPSLDDALQSTAINVAAVLICGYLTYRDWKAGETNLARIAKGGALAQLVVNGPSPRTLASYRRNARVLIAVGGDGYIDTLCRSLNADQRADVNSLPQALSEAEVVIVPVLLQRNGETDWRVGDVKSRWSATEPTDSDRNMDVTRADEVVAFPRSPGPWIDYLRDEIATAQSQGFDVLQKGFIIVVKKNGRILRRATGQPPFDELVSNMEVLDGSKFGMPGDDEKYSSKPL
ncbi:predicted protein [Phaeodactylum tricornutum CCAP 1055/1]|uniref:Protein LOW PSII ACCUMULATION 1, chloroplastic n=1 Tax=Phaeodactylum tricornutum (strain CCAP 1055/1) TaxID=556484 RepID=B7G0T5_PHATC|nr:predicted protein [Phaeodactylum tricornutum CCAP 1055/1]EEC47945.1 predicted protein [Phaeodactylum tricornutum CCAP 1055/1]|eukprot:XP_002180537.1 predicted protein [Phaeodactylum tricornutum CCAP 1055/1]